MMILRRLCLCLFALSLTSTGAGAQTYPDYVSTTVNDFADLLPEADEIALSDRLERLEKLTGVEMTVVTLATQEDFAPDLSMEGFATGLFDHWGIGKAETNDGVLVLILRDDRAMRIELGLAYGWDWNRVAQRVVDDHFLPAFRNDDYRTGILEGTEATITEIVMPFLEGRPAPEFASEDSGSGGDTVGILMMVGFTVILALTALRHKIGDQLVRLRACPNCGARALTQTRTTLFAATRSASGQGERLRVCSACGYEDRSTYVIPRIRQSRGGGSFGGGRSGGGGASGRW